MSFATFVNFPLTRVIPENPIYISATVIELLYYWLDCYDVGEAKICVVLYSMCGPN